MENRYSKIKIIMGLGNPGAEYKNTFHNAGLIMLDYLLDKHNVGGWSRRGSAQNSFESCKIDGLILIKSLNFMNENGDTAKFALKFFNNKTDSLMVIHDDSDIEIGKYKISFGRGSAGHNGVESVIKSLGTKNFWRLRIGIRKKSAKEKAMDFVLKKITEKDKKIVLSSFENAYKEIFGSDQKTI